MIANDDFPSIREVLNTRTCPIYRQRILRTMPVKGLWWMDENQWVRFAWKGHGHVVKSGDDPDRVITTRYFEVGSAYVRIDQDNKRVDIEALTRTTKWIPGGRKFKKKRTVREWVTVTVTLEEYQNLVDNYLGPVQDVCHRHNKQ